jgi:predicted ATPase
MRRLKTLTVKNFKSIREQTLHLGSLNVFIGANGSGKSNLIEVFRFLQEVVKKNLAGYTLRKGGADRLLYFGRKTSDYMHIGLEFGEAAGTSNKYEVTLTGTNDDALVIANETASYHGNGPTPVFRHTQLVTDPLITEHVRESNLRDKADPLSRQILNDLERYRIYHFHDTSEDAKVKGTSDVHDNRYLKSRADNLAAFLYWMQQKRPNYFANIRDTVRQIAPFFADFILQPSRLNEEKIRLEWKEVGSDAYFNASALSDGTLRFICLVTLLMQPDLPALVLLDEPELGLHPAAITVLASLLTSAATRTQVIVATQSVTLVNQFEPSDIWTADREDRQTVFRRLNESDMASWLDDYALGDLWEKNVLGARP